MRQSRTSWWAATTARTPRTCCWRLWPKQIVWRGTYAKLYMGSKKDLADISVHSNCIWVLQCITVSHLLKVLSDSCNSTLYVMSDVSTSVWKCRMSQRLDPRPVWPLQWTGEWGWPRPRVTNWWPSPPTWTLTSPPSSQFYRWPISSEWVGQWDSQDTATESHYCTFSILKVHQLSLKGSW